MYLITAIDRIDTCLCAFVGGDMMGMPVDRYRRVYKRKIYVAEWEKIYLFKKGKNDKENMF